MTTESQQSNMMARWSQAGSNHLCQLPPTLTLDDTNHSSHRICHVNVTGGGSPYSLQQELWQLPHIQKDHCGDSTMPRLRTQALDTAEEARHKDGEDEILEVWLVGSRVLKEHMVNLCGSW